MLAILLASAARLLLDRVFGYHHQYAVFYIAVLWTAWYAGFRPAVVAIALGGIAIIALAASSPFWRGDAGGGLVGFEFYFIVAFTGAILLKAQQTAERKSAWNARVARERLRRLESETEQRKTAQEAVTQTQQQFRLALEHAPVGICQVAPDGAISEVNPELCRILGRPREDLLIRRSPRCCFRMPPMRFRITVACWRGASIRTTTRGATRAKTGQPSGPASSWPRFAAPPAGHRMRLR